MSTIVSYAENNKNKIKKTEVIEDIVEEELIKHETDSGFETYKKLFKES